MKDSVSKNFYKDFLSGNLNTVIVLFALITLIIFFSFFNPNFFTAKNAVAIGLLLSVVGVICIGQTLCILIRGFDLSVGQLAALSGVVLAVLTKAGVNYFAGLLIVFTMGLVCGTIAGFLIAKLKINALITTLALQVVYLGLVYIIADGSSVMVGSPIYSVLGTTRWLGMPVPVILLIILYFLFYFILKHTVFGRSIYCIGGNPEASRISGINVDKVVITVYILSSMLAVFAGVVLTSRMGAAQVSAGGTYALDSVAAVVLGGVALSGGKGSIWGAFLGIAIMGVMQNGLIMIQMPTFYQFIATGIVLILAVFAQNISVIRSK